MRRRGIILLAMREIADLDEARTAAVLEEVGRRQRVKRDGSQAGRGRLEAAVDGFVFWLSKHWLAVLNTLAFFYVGLPILAPALMHWGVEWAGRGIYRIYSPLCHQLPQRSHFLFGPQFSYRLPELMEVAGESVAGPWANEFLGTPALGYKIALCQRDVAIYGAIFLVGVAYSLLRRRWAIRPLRWWMYILVGLVPMGLDGGYQLLSYVLPLVLPGIGLEPYETTALMRVITGTLFGWATVWLAYPYLDESMKDVRASLERRLGST